MSAAVPRLERFSDTASAERRAPRKWSPREVIGHLIDSASNNHGRFVRAQLSEDLVFPGYEQEGWVRLQAYRAAPWAELVALWRAYSLQIARIIEAIPGNDLKRIADQAHELGWRNFSETQPASLEDLIVDYVGHIVHHLEQSVELPSSSQVFTRSE